MNTTEKNLAHKVILLRHGQSNWNEKNLFTGWCDVGLTEKGVAEAIRAGQLIKESAIEIDIAYTSYLKRAIKTLWLALEEMDCMWIEVIKDWHLNERHYGALQGKNKAETSRRYGDEQVHIWRRSYDIRPPELPRETQMNASQNKQYASLDSSEIPLSESLKDTAARFLPYWQQQIVPTLKKRKNCLVAAHGNSLRALVQHLQQLSNEEIVKVNIPTGKPMVVELDQDMGYIQSYYLGETIYQ